MEVVNLVDIQQNLNAMVKSVHKILIVCRLIALMILACYVVMQLENTVMGRLAIWILIVHQTLVLMLFVQPAMKTISVME
jgi:hypothetical protein